MQTECASADWGGGVEKESCSNLQSQAQAEGPTCNPHHVSIAQSTTFPQTRGNGGSLCSSRAEPSQQAGYRKPILPEKFAN